MCFECGIVCSLVILVNVTMHLCLENLIFLIVMCLFIITSRWSQKRVLNKIFFSPGSSSHGRASATSSWSSSRTTKTLSNSSADVNMSNTSTKLERTQSKKVVRFLNCLFGTIHFVLQI